MKHAKPIRKEVAQLGHLDDDTLLTMHEVEAVLYASRSKILRLSAQGKLPKVYIGHSIRFRAGDVRKLIQEEKRS